MIEAFRLRYLAYGSEDTSYIDSELFPLDMEFDIYDDIISLWAMDGDDVGGYEKIVFELPPSILDKR